jgi:hypothetical protein
MALPDYQPSLYLERGHSSALPPHYVLVNSQPNVHLYSAPQECCIYRVRKVSAYILGLGKNEATCQDRATS